MNVPTVACTNCGKNFTTDDLRGTSCKFCGTLLAHHARAQQQVAVVNEMMADRNGNGIPDAYEGLVANAQANAMNQAFGMNAMNPYGQQPYGQQPYGQPPMMGNPMMSPLYAQQTVAKSMNMMVIMIVVGVSLAVLGMMAAGFIFAVGR